MSEYGTKWMEGSTEPCRQYTRNEAEPTVIFAAVEPESITYSRGSVCVKLTGFNAWLYRGMIGMYGKKEATERFWWIWHKKTAASPQKQPLLLERAQSI